MTKPAITQLTRQGYYTPASILSCRVLGHFGLVSYSSGWGCV